MTETDAPEAVPDPEAQPGPEPEAGPSGPTRRRRRRWPVVLALVLVLVVTSFYVGGAWYFSGQIYGEVLQVEESAPDLFEVTAVVARNDGTGLVTLRMGDDAATRADTTALTGLAWRDSYAQSGRATAVDGDLVTRPYTMVLGVPPRVGDQVDLDGWYFPEDPDVGLGLAFQDVTYASPLAKFPAWYVPGRPGETTWAIFIHGKGAAPREALRSMQVVAGRGLPMLAISYRNDPGEAASPNDMYGYGVDEYQDLAAAVEYAVDNGAQKVVLFGFSMGGATTLKFLYDDPLASKVGGAVLDAPASNMGKVVDERAEDRRLPLVGLPIPETLESVALWMTEQRYDMSFKEINYVRRAEELPVPVLLLQGRRDQTVPAVVNDELAAAAPDAITYQTFADAAHVRSWNSERERYERLVDDYLSRIVPDRQATQ